MSDDKSTEEELDFVSKSELKRESLAMQKLGEEICALPDSKLAKLELPTDLENAIHEYRRLKKNEAKRRQMQFIGKLMRAADSHDIEMQLKVFRHEKRFANQYFHKLEQLRDRLLANDNEVIQELVEQYPAIDRQQLRTYVRNASKEKQQSKPPKHARQLFQYLKEHIPEEF